MQFLGKIISPILLEDFFKNNWNKSFLKVEGDKNKFTDILDLRTFRTLIEDNAHLLSFPQVTLFKNESMLNENMYTKKWKQRISGTLGFKEKISIDISKINSLLNNGVTIKISQFEIICTNLKKYLNNFSDEVNSEMIYINAFYSTASTKAFSPHFDEHDVFILQVYGEKMWEVFDSFQDNPLQEYRGALTDAFKQTQKTEFKLRQGDFLFVPRGMWHNVYSTNEPSLHLTIGIRTKTPIDLVYWIQERLLSKSDFRKSLLSTHKIDDDTKSLIINSIKNILEDDKIMESFFDTTKANLSTNPKLNIN